MRVRNILKILLLLGILYTGEAACQSCLLPALHPHRHKRPLASPAFGVALGSCSGLALRSRLPKLLSKPVLVAVGCTLAARAGLEWVRRAEESVDTAADSADESDEATEEKPVSEAMVSAIGVYKNFISPLLPPACRFVPTCSQYGVQAIEEFGPSKGAVLTAWRILRCSPFGGKGYDPPKWPPVSYTYSSY